MEGACRKLRRRLLADILEQRRYTRATHSAVFVEVRVDEELGTVRMMRVVSSAAISNAIFHATGKRIRSTPITPGEVMR